MQRQVELKRYKTTLSMVHWVEVDEWAKKPRKADVIQVLVSRLLDGEMEEYFTCNVEEL